MLNNIVLTDGTLYLLVKLCVLGLAILLWWVMNAPVAV